jgi:hypothetical protein
VNRIRGVARAALAGVIALLCMLLAVDVVSAQPAPGADRSDSRIERAEPLGDLCDEREHTRRHLIRPTASAVPMSDPRSGSATADADGADDDTMTAATAASLAARHVVPLSRSGQLPVVLQVFRC